jgi:hypothetical protein
VQSPTAVVTPATQAAFAPLVAAVAFLMSDPQRNLTATLPVPAR